MLFMEGTLGLLNMLYYRDNQLIISLSGCFTVRPILAILADIPIKLKRFAMVS